MPLDGFEALFAEADATRPGVGVAVVGGADVTVLEATGEAARRGWVEPHLFGDAEETRALALASGMDPARWHLEPSSDPARDAVRCVRAGRCRLLMKGQVATPALMQGVLDAETGLRAGRVIAQVVLLEIAGADRRFLLADTGITPRPTLEQKLDILRSTVGVAHALGEPSPRVALVAASEKPTPALPDTLEAAEIQQRAAAGEVGGCLVQGPLSFDLAYAPDAGARKGVAGPAVGGADVMLFPDLTSANLTVKAIMYTAPCRFGGVLVGAAAPVVFMSRADAAATRLSSLALALRVLARGAPG
jgi:phosphotransacetylase